MNRVKELRNENNFSLQDVVNKTGISKSTLSNYEHGRAEPQRGNADTLAKFFNVSIPYLKGDSNFRDEKKIQKYAEEILLKGIEAKIPTEFTDDDTVNLEIKYLIMQIEQININADAGKRNFLINIMRKTLDIYELMEKFIDDKPYDDFEILFDKFKNLILKVTNNEIVTCNFYEQLADFDDEVKEFYVKNKDN